KSVKFSKVCQVCQPMFADRKARRAIMVRLAIKLCIVIGLGLVASSAARAQLLLSAESSKVWPDQSSLTTLPMLEPVNNPADTPDTGKSPDAGKAADADKAPDKLGALDQKLDALTKNLTITTGDPDIKVVFGGVITTDAIYSSAREVAPGTPFFLTAGPTP